MDKQILFCLAHPDDEIGCGPLVTRYAAEGVQSTLICTTNGDVGTVEEKYMRNYSSIPELRLAELKAATTALGFAEVVTFGYRDSGMMGSADNADPLSSWQAPAEELTERVKEVMRRVRPQVVVTFNTFGAYGHPDHIKINQATVAAFNQLQSEPNHPQKLYYVTFAKGFIRVILTVMRLLGKDPRKLGVNKDMDFVSVYEALTPITTRVPVARYLAPSWAASDSYASQISTSNFRRTARRFYGPLLQGNVNLSRVYPEPKPHEQIEHDLFQGVILQQD